MPKEQAHPPKARPISKLKIKKQIYGPLHRHKSKHNVYKAYELKDDKRKNIIFKEVTSQMAQFEPYNAAVNRLIATSRYVPPMNEYYDERTHKSAGVGSKEWSNFKTFHCEPMQKQDLELNSSIINIEMQQNIILNTIDRLSLLYKNKKFTPQLRSGFAATISSFFQNYLHQDLQPTFEEYLNDSNKFSMSSIQVLIEIIQKKLSQLPRTLNNQDEIEYLTEIKSAAIKLQDLNYNPQLNPLTLLDYVEYDRQIEAQDLNLVEGDMLPTLNIFGHDMELPADELIKFRKIKGLAIATTTRTITKEGDFNEESFDQNGRMVDFDKNKFDVLFNVCDLEDYDPILREPNANAFKLTTYDFEHLPDVKDLDLFYWPGKETTLAPFIIEVISQFLTKCGNFPFEENDTIHGMILNTIQKITMRFVPEQEKAYAEKIDDYIYGVSLRLKALLLGTTTERLISIEERKLIFETIKLKFLEFITKNKDLLIEIERQLAKLLGNENKTFNKEHSDFFKLIGTHPVFIYFKNATSLKYAITDEKMYQNLFALYVMENSNSNSSWKHKLIADEISRITEVTSILKSSDQFKAFLNLYGEYVITNIKNQFSELRSKKEIKLVEKKQDPSVSEDFINTYEGFVKSLDLKKIEEHYNSLRDEILAEKSTWRFGFA